MPTTEAEQLSLEWRKLVIDKLTSLESSQTSVAKDIGDIKLTFANNTKVDALADEVEKLKIYKAKVAGVIIASNALAIFLGWAIQSWIFFHKG